MSASQGDAGVSTPLMLDVPAQALLGDPLRGVFYGTVQGSASLAVSPNGLTPTKYQYLVSGFSTSIVYANQRIYSSNGTVLDVSAPEAPKKSGTFAFSGLAVLPLPNSTCTLMLSPGTPTADSLALRLLDVQTFTQVDSKAYSLDLAYTFDLVIADGGWLAFRGFNSFQSPRVYILENPFAGSW